MNGAERLRVASFNVWFGEFQFERRAIALLELLESLDADVIGLQEVTPEFLAMLRQCSWTSAYQLSATLPHALAPYGVLLMSRVPGTKFSEHELWTYQGRRLILGELADGLCVATVHLESRRAAQEIRVTQLEEIFERLGSDPFIFMGDMNFDGGAAEESALPEACADLWPQLRPGERGTTFNTTRNAMAAAHSSRLKEVRFDRIFLRAPDYEALSIERLGLDPLEGHPEIWPSDHFGLVAQLRRRTGGD